LFLLSAVVEEKSLVPFRIRTFKASSSSDSFFESQLHEGIGSVKLKMLVAIIYLIISLSLILECSEESVSVHIDVRLLTVETLTIASKSIIHNICQVHHLLLLEFIFFILEIFDSFE